MSIRIEFYLLMNSKFQEYFNIHNTSTHLQHLLYLLDSFYEFELIFKSLINQMNSWPLLYIAKLSPTQLLNFIKAKGDNVCMGGHEVMDLG